MKKAATFNLLSGGLRLHGHLFEGVLTDGMTEEVTVVQPIGSSLRATLTRYLKHPMETHIEE